MNRRSEHPTLSVVLPTRNEEGHIAAFCGAILRAFENLSVAVEVVVVDASDDDTWACLEGVSQNDPRLRVFRQESLGFSGALAEGLCKAQGEWVLAMNSDGNHRIEDAIALFESRVAQQCLVGSRFVQGGGSDISYFRFLMSQYASRIVGRLAGTGLRENFSSFFLVERVHLTSKLIARHMHGHGEGMLKLLVALKSLGLTVREYPVTYGPRLSGSSKTDLLLFLIHYARAAFSIRRQRPPHPIFPLLGRLAQFFPVVLLAWCISENPEVLGSLSEATLALGASFLFLVSSVLMRGVRFYGIARTLHANLSLKRLASDIIGARYWNEALPMRLGDALRIERLVRRDGTPMFLAAAMLIWEKIVGISVGLLALTTAFIMYEFSPEFDLSVSVELSIMLLAPLLLAWVLWSSVFLGLRGCLRWGLARIDLDRFRTEARGVKAQFVGPDWTIQLPLGALDTWLSKGIEVLRECPALLWPKPLMAAVSSSLFVWVLVAASLVSLASAIGVDAPLSALMLCAFGTGAAVQVRLLPGGFGQVELTQAALLNACGVPLADSIFLAATYVISMRVTNVVLGLVRIAAAKQPAHD